MSARKLTKCGSTLCNRYEIVTNYIHRDTAKVGGSYFSYALLAVSGQRKLHSSATHKQQLRIEGIQGTIPDPLSAKENKRLLERALSQSSVGFSQQGVQAGCRLHTSGEQTNKANPRVAGAGDWEWELEDAACPQGVQGAVTPDAPCGHFQAWLHSCRRYGLANCDQQLQGVQSGRVTLAQVLADQEALIAEISERYRMRADELPGVSDESMQGAQGNMQLPDVAAPCPQGIQGDDCVRFKLWLENCHRFGMHDCLQQYQGLQAGRLTLAQLFDQQDIAIRQVVHQYQQRRSYSTGPREPAATPATGAPQVGDSTGAPQVGDSTAPPQLTQRQRLKRAIKEYGSTVIVFHVAISLASLGGFYLAVSSGIDMVGILKSVGVGESILESRLATGTGTFVVAYAVHKVFAPVRIGITLTSTPLIVRFLRSKGVLKPPKKTS